MLAEYPFNAFPSPYTAAYAVGAVWTDSGFIGGIGGCAAQNQEQEFRSHTLTFAYQFDDRNAPGLNDTVPGYMWGAGHAMELAYMWPSFDNGIPLYPQLTPAQLELSNWMVRYWGAFARFGAPLVRGQTFWPPYQSGQHALAAAGQRLGGDLGRRVRRRAQLLVLGFAAGRVGPAGLGSQPRTRPDRGGERGFSATCGSQLRARRHNGAECRVMPQTPKLNGRRSHHVRPAAGPGSRLPSATLDRAAHLRDDDDIRRVRGLDTSRAVLVGADQQVALTEAGALALAPLSALAPDGPLTFLGLEPSGAPVFAYDALDHGHATGQLRLAANRRRELDAAEAALAAYAVGMVGWHRVNRFCGRSGHATEVEAAGHRRRCPGCGLLQFPRTDPAVTMLVTASERCLLSRRHGAPRNRWSALAGFIEPGETPEQAVVREAREETGVGSWPSSTSPPSRGRSPPR